jgi:hypothetical protein
MQYQLTLQFRGDSLGDYDAMVALEGELTEQVGDSADVDGHDCGSGETNIFIFTPDPAAPFQRLVDGERYTVIWPEGSQREFRVA